MSPDLLQTFLIVSRTRNITRAAEELLVSQPAVSRQIQQLERELGVALFDRLGKSLHLTQAGQRLADESGEVLGHLERLAEVIRGYQEPGKGKLRIGASTTPGYYLLPPILGRYLRKHPGVELHYVVENSLSIEERIVRNELDLGVVGGHLARQEILMEHLADDEIVCVCGVGHELAATRRVGVARVSRETWITREKGSATRDLFERRLVAAGGKVTRRIELNSPEGIKAMVAAGIGVTYLSIHAVQQDIQVKRLRLLSVSGLRTTRPIYVVMHPDKHVPPDLEAVRELLRREVGRIR